MRVIVYNKVFKSTKTFNNVFQIIEHEMSIDLKTTDKEVLTITKHFCTFIISI